LNVALGTNSNAAGASTSNVAIGGSANANSLTNTAGGNVAIGLNSNATGGQTTAVGSNASATLANSAAFGNGAVATRANQQMFGTASNTYTMAGITSAASAAAQKGPVQVVTSDAGGNLASDRRHREERERRSDRALDCFVPHAMTTTNHNNR
jgi:trimeric autotransporter adhesin